MAAVPPAKLLQLPTYHPAIEIAGDIDFLDRGVSCPFKHDILHYRRLIVVCTLQATAVV